MLSANARREAYRAEVVPWPAKPLKYLMEPNVKSPYYVNLGTRGRRQLTLLLTVRANPACLDPPRDR